MILDTILFMDKLVDGCNVPKRVIKNIESLTTKQSKEIIKKSKKIDESVFFHGEPGTGKTVSAVTHVLKDLKNEYYYEGILRFENVTNLLHKIRKTYKQSYDSKGNLSDETTILNECRFADYLILDDFGVEKTSDWSLQTLYLIINSRYENLKPTVITSNLSIEELYEKMEDNRIISRIQSMCQIVKCLKQYRNI